MYLHFFAPKFSEFVIYESLFPHFLFRPSLLLSSHPDSLDPKIPTVQCSFSSDKSFPNSTFCGRFPSTTSHHHSWWWPNKTNKENWLVFKSLGLHSCLLAFEFETKFNEMPQLTDQSNHHFPLFPTPKCVCCVAVVFVLHFNGGHPSLHFSP